MFEVHAPMTALESRCEEELSTLPGWHSELEKIELVRTVQPPKESEKEKRIEESMVLGV